MPDVLYMGLQDDPRAVGRRPAAVLAVRLGR